MSVALTLANVKGENIEGSIEFCLVPDIVEPLGRCSKDTHSHEPVNSHGV